MYKPLLLSLSMIFLFSCNHDENVQLSTSNDEENTANYYTVIEDVDPDAHHDHSHHEYGVLQSNDQMVRLDTEQNDLMKLKFKSGDRLKIQTNNLSTFVKKDFNIGKVDINKDISATSRNNNSTKQLLAVIVNMPSSTVSCTEDEIFEKCFSTNPNTKSVHSFYNDQSQGAISFEGDVVTIDLDEDEIYMGNIDFKAKTLLIDLGYNTINYDHVAYFTESIAGYLGLAYLNGKISHIDLCGSEYVLVHEIGHNLGLHHASMLNSNGSQSTYGDCSSPMGCSYNELNALNRHYLGWIANAKIKKIKGPSSNFNLTPLEMPAGGGSKQMGVMAKNTVNYELILSSREYSNPFSDEMPDDFIGTISIHQNNFTSKSLLLETLFEGDTYYDAAFDKTIKHDGMNNNGSVKVKVY